MKPNLRPSLILLILLSIPLLFLGANYRGTSTINDWIPPKGADGPNIRSLTVKWAMNDFKGGCEESFNVQWYLGDYFVYKTNKIPIGRIGPDIDKLSIVNLVLRAAVYSDGEFVVHRFLDVGITPPHGGSWSSSDAVQVEWKDLFTGINADSAQKVFESDIELREIEIFELEFGGLVEIGRRIDQIMIEDAYKVFMSDGLRAMDNRDYVNAILAFRQAVDLLPGDPEANRRLTEAQFGQVMALGETAFAAGDFEAAILHYRDAQRFLPDHPDPRNRIMEAETLIAKGKEYQRLKLQLSEKYAGEILIAKASAEDAITMAATAFEPESESCNLQNADYLACIQKYFEKKRDVSEHEAYYLVYDDPSAKVKAEVPELCVKPACDRFDDPESAGIADAAELLETARRKWKVYNQYKYEDFRSSSRDFLDRSFQLDPRNAEAFLFRAGLQPNLMEKMADLIEAIQIDPQLKEAIDMRDGMKNDLYKELYDRIRNSDLVYLKRALDLNLLDGLTTFMGFSPVAYALENDKPAALELLLASNAVYRTQEQDPQGLLYVAAAKNRAACASFLLSKGALLDHRNAEGKSPMIVASESGSKEVMDLFLGKDGSESDKSEALRLAVLKNDYSMTETLIAAGADLDQPDKEGDNLLMTAIRNGHREIGLKLIEAGAEPDRINLVSETPLTLAMEQGFEDLAKILLDKGVDASRALVYLDGKNADGLKRLAALLIERAVTQNDPDAASLSVKYVPELAISNRQGGKSYVLYALAQGQQEVLGRLLMANVDFGKPLDGGKYLLLELVSAGEEKSVEYLLTQKRISLDVSDDKGASALHIAASKGNIEMMRLLLSQGHPMDVKDKRGNTPLVEAILAGQDEAALHLISSGAGKSISTARNQQPIHLAAAGRQLTIVKALVSAGVDVNEKGESGMAPLHYAALNGDFDMANYLLEQGADRKMKDFFNRTPAKIAKKEKFKDLAKFIK